MSDESVESRSLSASPSPMEEAAPQPQTQPARRRKVAQLPQQQQELQQAPQQQQLQLQPLQQQQVQGRGDRAVGNPAGQAGQLLGSTLGQVTGGEEQSSGGKKDTLKLRLDLNLEIDVQIKARIHGDITLSLLS